MLTRLGPESRYTWTRVLLLVVLVVFNESRLSGIQTGEVNLANDLEMFLGLLFPNGIMMRIPVVTVVVQIEDKKHFVLRSRPGTTAFSPFSTRRFPATETRLFET